jgi:hypothetical protein
MDTENNPTHITAGLSHCRRPPPRASGGQASQERGVAGACDDCHLNGRKGRMLYSPTRDRQASWDEAAASSDLEEAPLLKGIDCGLGLPKGYSLQSD